MATWGELLKELLDSVQSTGVIPLDEIRRRALRVLSEHTGRPTVAYASRWVQGGGEPQATTISIGDLHAFMEVLHGLQGPSLDLILHSSGGSPTAAEAIVNYVRTKFEDVRVFVPLAAMSAATMMACAGNRIVMGKHSYLGPIDPQLLLQTPLGEQFIPAQAIIEQFKDAQDAAANTASFPAWIPMLQQYGPGLLTQCKNVVRLSEELVGSWLQKWMFAGLDDAAQKAKVVAAALNAHGQHKVHGRFLSRDVVRELGLVVEDLEASQELQDAVLTVFHAFSHTFAMNATVMKIVENHHGRAYVVSRAILPNGGPRTPPSPAPPEPPLPPRGP